MIKNKIQNRILTSISPQLTNQLSELKGLQAVAKCQEVQQYLIPLLKETQQAWVNPQEFPDNKSFLREYNLRWSKAQVYKELLTLLNEQELDRRIKDTQKMIDKEVINYQIGNAR